MNSLILILSLLLSNSVAFPVGKIIALGSIARSSIVKGPQYGNVVRLKHGMFPNHDLSGNDIIIFNNSDYSNRFLAIDCEMVGIRNNTKSALARVSIVDYYGHIVLDTYVKPMEPVSHYRTWVSGIHWHHLRNASNFHTVQAIVANHLNGKILIGHAIKNDLKALGLSHPESMIRDTSRFERFRIYSKGQKNTPSLKLLAKKLLNLDIQSSSHSSVEDARITMLLFQLGMEMWTDDHLN